MQRADLRSIFRSRLIVASFALALVVLAGSGGYYALGAGRWSAEEVVYFTIITLSTVGFAETLPGMTEVPHARLLTVGLIVFGSGTLVYFISTLTALIVEGDLHGAIRRKKMQKKISDLEGHFIVCGVGSTGVHVVDELVKTRHAFVAIDVDEERLTALAEKHAPHPFHYVHGDATHDEVLGKAGIGRAAGILSALTDDKDNLFVTLTAYQLARERADRGEFRIVAKAVEPSTPAKLRAAGAHRVVSPTQIGGMRMVSEMIRPTVVEFLDLMLRDRDKTLRIEEVPIGEGSRLGGVPLRDTGIRAATRALVIAVRLPGEPPRFEYNPGPELRLEAGMTLIVLGESEDIARLREGIAEGTLGRTAVRRQRHEER